VIGRPKTKKPLRLRGLSPLTPWPWALPLDTAGGCAPTSNGSVIGSRSRARHDCMGLGPNPPPILFSSAATAPHLLARVCRRPISASRIPQVASVPPSCPTVPTLQGGGAQPKSGGHFKKISGALRRKRCARSLLKSFRHLWSRHSSLRDRVLYLRETVVPSSLQTCCCDTSFPLNYYCISIVQTFSQLQWVKSVNI